MSHPEESLETRVHRLERRQRRVTLLLSLLAVGLAAAVPPALSALAVPHAFSEGTVASAEDMNENFAALKDAIVASQPFVHSRINGVASSVAYSSAAFTNIAQTVESVTLPPGRVLLTWHLGCYSGAGSGYYQVRPFVGGALAPAQTVYANEDGSHRSYSGSWSTTTTGGPLNVGLQISVQNGNCTLNQHDHVAWTITVFPDP